MKDKIARFFNSSYKLLCMIMLVLWGGLILLTLNYIIPSTSIASELIVLIGVIVYLLFLLFIYRKLEKATSKTCNVIALVITIISFIILVTWGLTHYSLPPYDLCHITDLVKILFHNENHIIGEFAYFSKYPHQIPIFILVYFVEYIGKILFNAPEVTIIIFNCFMLSLSFYFVNALLLKKISTCFILLYRFFIL